MNQARVFRSKATKRLEEHIEHLQECLTDAVAEFDQWHHVPADVIFNYIDDDTIAGSFGYAHMEDCDTVLRWDWFPNPDAEPNEETDAERDEGLDKHELQARLDNLRRRRKPILARLEHRR